jgi:glyoxylase-like metal-dependent hydrolase (beta-lactamase superfamily II)
MTEQPLHFPFSPHPTPGEVRRIADGIFWVRMPLPFRLSHINVWIIDDGDGWAIVDFGIDDAPTRELWSGIMSRFMAGRPLRRLIATHSHTDHVGVVKFLTTWNDPRFEITQTEWTAARNRYAAHQQNNIVELQRFLHRHGGAVETAVAFDRERQRVQSYLGPQPDIFIRLAAGQEIKLGGRTWRIITGGGHADEHACFYCETDRILIAGDQILPRISPVIAVAPAMPDADPLRDYFAALTELGGLPDDILVLPGHGDPFYGLRTRIGQLVAHHHVRLHNLEGFIRRPLSAVAATELLFPKAVEVGQGRLALGETIAHLHRLVGTERAVSDTDDDGCIKFTSAA